MFQFIEISPTHSNLKTKYIRQEYDINTPPDICNKAHSTCQRGHYMIPHSTQQQASEAARTDGNLLASLIQKRNRGLGQLPEDVQLGETVVKRTRSLFCMLLFHCSIQAVEIKLNDMKQSNLNPPFLTHCQSIHNFPYFPV